MQSLKFTIKENTREKYQRCREVTFRLQPMLEAWSFFFIRKQEWKCLPMEYESRIKKIWIFEKSNPLYRNLNSWESQELTTVREFFIRNCKAWFVKYYISKKQFDK